MTTKLQLNVQNEVVMYISHLTTKIKANRQTKQKGNQKTLLMTVHCIIRISYTP